MAYRKRTLRRLSPVARKLAKLICELDSISARAKNMLIAIQELEHDSTALSNARQLNICSECGKRIADDLEKELIDVSRT
jgi:hypothetical protein